MVFYPERGSVALKDACGFPGGAQSSASLVPFSLKLFTSKGNKVRRGKDPQTKSLLFSKQWLKKGSRAQRINERGT